MTCLVNSMYEKFSGEERHAANAWLQCVYGHCPEPGQFVDDIPTALAKIKEQKCKLVGRDLSTKIDCSLKGVPRRGRFSARQRTGDRVLKLGGVGKERQQSMDVWSLYGLERYCHSDQRVREGFINALSGAGKTHFVENWFSSGECRDRLIDADTLLARRVNQYGSFEAARLKWFEDIERHVLDGWCVIGHVGDRSVLADWLDRGILVAHVPVSKTTLEERQAQGLLRPDQAKRLRLHFDAEDEWARSNLPIVPTFAEAVSVGRQHYGHRKQRALHGRDDALNDVVERVMRGEAAACVDLVGLLENTVEVWSVDVMNRAKLQPRLLSRWLLGRKDLLWAVSSLVGAVHLGYSCFMNLAAVLCAFGAHPVLVATLEAGVFDGCMKCAMSKLKAIKQSVRVHPQTLDGEDHFLWQYVGMLIGRHTDDHLWDKEDVTARGPTDEHYVDNGLSHLRGEMLRKVKDEIRKEGFRYARLHLRSNPSATVLPHQDVLRQVASGSANSDLTQYCSGVDEIQKELLNKQIAYAYMSDDEAAAMVDWAKLHSHSIVVQKLEPDKNRSLVPGSNCLYHLQATLSERTEKAFMATLEGCPLMLGAASRNKLMLQLRSSMAAGFSGARDYANYNDLHESDELKLFYSSQREVYRQAGRLDLVEVCDKVIACLEDVGIEHEGEFYKWERGLMTGWRHTMLINTTFNVCIARAAYSIVEREFGMKVVAHLHQGDDTVEVSNDVLCCPMVQALCDAAGKVGKSDKQWFHAKRGQATEFTRELITPKGGAASPLRLVCSSMSGDMQHAVLSASPELARSMVENLNEVWRRNGCEIGLRDEDVLSMANYWGSVQDEQTGAWNEPLAMFAENYPMVKGGPAVLFGRVPKGLVLQGQWRRKLTRPEDAPKLVASCKKKLLGLSSLQISEFAKEYANDVLASTRVAKYRGKVNLSRKKTGLHFVEERMEVLERNWLRKELRALLQGRKVKRDQLITAVDIAVDSLFAGSRSVAEAYLSKYGMPRLSPGMRRVQMVRDGCRVMLEELKLRDELVLPILADLPSSYREVLETRIRQCIKGVKTQLRVLLNAGRELVGLGFFH